MPLVSSPPIYPPSSSPPQNHDQRKRARPADPFEPVKKRLLFGRGSASAKPEVQQVAARATAAENASTNHHHFAESNLQSKGPFSEHNDEEILEPSLTMNLHNDLSTAELPLPVLPSIEQRSKHGTTIGQIRPELAACIRTARGIRFPLHKRLAKAPIPYEQIVASRSKTAPGRAKTSYYGIDIHKLIDDAVQESNQVAKATPVKENLPLQSIEASANTTASRKRTMMWTEKYRARKFTDLVGDERTHRTVLRWLKDWDPIVFPGNNKPKPRSKVLDENTEERPHRKILLLAGPPGLGKTTLAHVCAKQTGYEVVEINASDERSREVVKGRIRDSVGTENVRGVNMKTGDGNVRKAGRPVCVVVDEVDGVVGGSGGSGEGGFIKALIDLVMLDQKNTKSTALGASTTKKGKKGDQFRMLRPMILICNDVYHSALKPLRASGLAEIIHIRKPPLDKVVARMKTVFDREGILNDKDGVRRLCEATWGVSNRRESRTSSNNTGEGDIRGVLVVGEWVASKLRASSNLSLNEKPRLTKQWVETHMLADLGHGGGGSRGIGRGGAKEAVDRVFLDGAGFPKSVALPSQNMSQRDARVRVGVTELGKRVAIQRLREVIDTSGECERIMADCFTVYPSHHFQDDVFLSKPNAAYEWLHFHDTLSSRIFAGQEWELNPYLSQSILGFHHLFASPAKNSWSNDQQNQWNGDGEEDPLPFTGPRANFSAYETEKANRSLLQQLQSSLSAPLLRSFRSPEELATDLLPQLIKMLTPDIKPVIVGGSGDQRGTASVRREGEREMARRAVETMSAVNVTFERSRIEDARGGFGGFVYRMEPYVTPLFRLTYIVSIEYSFSVLGLSIPSPHSKRPPLPPQHPRPLATPCAKSSIKSSRNTLSVNVRMHVKHAILLEILLTANSSSTPTSPRTIKRTSIILRLKLV